MAEYEGSRDIQRVKAPLDENNWQPWSDQVQSFLEGKDRWKWTTREPAAASAVAGGLSVDDADKQKTADTMARGFIKQQLTSSQVADVRALLTTKAVWDYLRQRYNVADANQDMLNLDSLDHLKYVDGTRLQEHLDRFRRLREQLAPSAFTLNEYYFAARLVLSMPVSWRTTISAINQSHTASTLTVSAVSTILLKEENLRKTLQALETPSFSSAGEAAATALKSTGPHMGQRSTRASATPVQYSLFRTGPLMHAAHIASTLDTLLPSAMRRTAVGL